MTVIASYARAASPSPVDRSRSPAPTFGKQHNSSLSDHEDLGLFTPSLRGKNFVDAECPTRCPTTCSTACPSSLDFFNSPSFVDDIESQESRGATANLKVSLLQFSDLRSFFAGEDRDGSGTWSPTVETCVDVPFTPRMSCDATEQAVSPPCVRAPSEVPPLLRALLMRSLEDVVKVLHSDPGAAREPFWDQEAEPPLCAAIGLLCCSEIIAFLLECGASVEHTDVHGRTALQVLHSLEVHQKLVTSEGLARIERMLLSAGADISEIREMAASPHAIAAAAPVDWGTGLPPSMLNVDVVQPPLPACWFSDALFDEPTSGQPFLDLWQNVQLPLPTGLVEDIFFDEPPLN